MTRSQIVVKYEKDGWASQPTFLYVDSLRGRAVKVVVQEGSSWVIVHRDWVGRWDVSKEMAQEEIEVQISLGVIPSPIDVFKELYYVPLAGQPVLDVSLWNISQFKIIPML